MLAAVRALSARGRDPYRGRADKVGGANRSQPLTIPGEMHVDLEDVRHLELRYSRAHPHKIDLSVEYVDGRIKVFEVDRYLIERLLEQLEDREAR